MKELTEKESTEIEKRLEKLVAKVPTAKKLFDFLKESFDLDPNVAGQEPPDAFVDKLNTVTSVLEGFFLTLVDVSKMRGEITEDIPLGFLTRMAYVVASMLLQDEEPILSKHSIVAIQFVNFDDDEEETEDASPDKGN